MSDTVKRDITNFQWKKRTAAISITTYNMFSCEKESTRMDVQAGIATREGHSPVDKHAEECFKSVYHTVFITNSIQRLQIRAGIPKLCQGCAAL